MSILTREEIDAIHNADDVMINCTRMNGEVTIEYYSDRKRWPAQIVVDVRNKRKYSATGKGEALIDVAKALRYPSDFAYNTACIDEPWEVNRRLNALYEGEEK